ncbi:hypothetical protein BgiBS90_015778 [Biomphalaria glabrata]|nr:hypothetical protein BgiBS90_015778 [Biomphalaria glabrata]
MAKPVTTRPWRPSVQSWLRREAKTKGADKLFGASMKRSLSTLSPQGAARASDPGFPLVGASGIKERGLQQHRSEKTTLNDTLSI